MTDKNWAHTAGTRLAIQRARCLRVPGAEPVTWKLILHLRTASAAPANEGAAALGLETSAWKTRPT